MASLKSFALYTLTVVSWASHGTVALYYTIMFSSLRLCAVSCVMLLWFIWLILILYPFLSPYVTSPHDRDSSPTRLRQTLEERFFNLPFTSTITLPDTRSRKHREAWPKTFHHLLEASSSQPLHMYISLYVQTPRPQVSALSPIQVWLSIILVFAWITERTILNLLGQVRPSTSKTTTLTLPFAKSHSRHLTCALCTKVPLGTLTYTQAYVWASCEAFWRSTPCLTSDDSPLHCCLYHLFLMRFST
jgi:hypothetical protein